MSRSKLEIARSLTSRGKYDKAVIVLDKAHEIYKNSFDYYLTFGITWLYAGVISHAEEYFNKARRIRINSVDLNLGFAAVFLYKGSTERAITYYLEVLRLEPGNKTAKSALEFLRRCDNYETILKYFDTGKMKKFYPSVGLPVSKFTLISGAAVLGAALALVLLNAVPSARPLRESEIDGLEDIALTADEKRNLQEKDLSGGVYKYILSDREIQHSYEKAVAYFNDFRDNMARVEINRILNSNASEAVRKKSELLLSYFETPNFDNFTDNFDYASVAKERELYDGCWVVWSGKITNVRTDESGLSFNLLIGDEKLENLEGVVSVVFNPVQKIDGSRSVKILGRLKTDGGRILLEGQSVYQPVRKKD